MTDDTIKTSIRGLLDESISMAVNAELPLNKLRGTALFDLTRDDRFTSLHSFAATVHLITTIPHFESRYGNANGTRLALQFLYQYFRRIDDVRFEQAAFEALWEDFWSELIEEPDWLYRGIANLRHFRTADSPLQPLDLGDGITILGRSPAELKALGFDDLIWERVAEDWKTPFGSSSYVLVTEHRLTKRACQFRFNGFLFAADQGS